MKGTWKLKLRLWLAMLFMFAIVYILIMLAGNFLGYGGFYGFYAIAGLVVLFLQYIFGPKIVESSMGVHQLSEAEAPELHRIVEELAMAANIPKPKVGISNTMVPNAFAYGRSKRSGHVCVTKGILGLAMATASREVTVDLPTPPLPDTTAMTFFTDAWGFKLSSRLSFLRSPQFAEQLAQLPLQELI